MLQRWQTIFLFLVGTLLLVAPFFVIAQGDLLPEGKALVHMLPGGEGLWILKPCSWRLINKADGAVLVIKVWPYGLSAVFDTLVAGVAWYSIAQHSNRQRQLILGKWNGRVLLLAMFWQLGLTLQVFAQTAPFALPGGYNETLTTMLAKIRPGALIPLSAYLLNKWASRCIRRDEHLVRSADRLR